MTSPEENKTTATETTEQNEANKAAVQAQEAAVLDPESRIFGIIGIEPVVEARIGGVHIRVAFAPVVIGYPLQHIETLLLVIPERMHIVHVD